MAARGYSRDHRPDCKQVCIGLVVTRQGFPLGYEIFAGNRTNVTTVEEIVEEMEVRYGKAKRVWVMDRGMISEEKPRVAPRGWSQVSDRHPAQRAAQVGAAPDGAEGLEADQGWPRGEAVPGSGRHGDIHPLPIARSTAQGEGDARSVPKRIVTGLQSLARRLERARRPVDRDGVERQIGRLLERNSRAGRM